MIMNCAQYTGPCRCGRTHTLETKKVVVDYGALDHFEEYMEELGLTGRRAVVYDTVIYKLTEGKHVKADQEIVLESKGLFSEKGLIENMMKQLDHPDVIVAFGAGTIMDSPTSWGFPLSRSRRSPALTASRRTSAPSSSTARKSPSP